MKVIKSSVSILPQEPGVVGMLRHIERVGRIAYKSEDKITDSSYLRFVDNVLYKRGHWAVFNLGTVYLRIPRVPSDSEDCKHLLGLLGNKYTRYTEDNDVYYITTDYRVTLKLRISRDFLEKYWMEPGNDPRFHHRITSHWICSRGVSHELVRHRCMCPIMESQRYVNYGKERHGGEITYIFPQWMYRVRDELKRYAGQSVYSSYRDDVDDLEEHDLLRYLCTVDRTVASRYRTWEFLESEYIYETTTDEGEHLKPEEARGILCNDTKTELCITGFLDDYRREPDIDTPEKEGFFYLRTAPDCHPDFKVLADDLKKQFEDTGLLSLER